MTIFSSSVSMYAVGKLLNGQPARATAMGRVLRRVCGQVPLWFAFALTLGAQTGTPAPTNALRDGTIRSRMLENGLQVIVVRSDAIPFATVEMVFRAGAFTQIYDELQGVPHLLEHMLFRKADRGPEGTFSGRASAIDASWNGVTSDETVRYYLLAPSKHIAKSIDLVSDLVRQAIFTDEGLDVERRVVRGELERRAAEPEALLRVVADRQLWTDAGWERKNAGGNMIAITGASLDQLKDLHKRYYVPNNAALIITGDVNVDEVFSLAEAKFRGWKRGPDPLASLPALDIAPLKAITRETFTASVRDVTFLIRWHGPSVGRDRAATYAADVFAGLVNQSLSGTQRRLVDTGLFEGVSLSYDTKRFVGPIELYAKTTPEQAVAAATALGAELGKLVRPDYFDASDLGFARKRQRVYAEFRAEQASGYAHTLAEMWSSADLDYQLTYADSIDNRTASDVQRFVDAYLKGKPMSITVMMSYPTQQAIALPLRNALAAWKAP